MVVAFFLFTALSAINHALTSQVSANNQFRLMTNHKVSITRSLPVNYQQKIMALSGVEQVTYASWFGGYFQNEKNQLAMTAVEHSSYFSLFKEYNIDAEQLSLWQKTRTGVIIGQEVAEKFAWKIGDKIPLSSSIWMDKEGSFVWEFIVMGIYKPNDASVDDRQVFFQHAYFDEARAYANYMASWFSTGIAPTASVDEVAKRIDSQFVNSNASTRTTTEQVFIKEQAQQFVDMALIIKVVVSAVFFTLLLIVCNTIAQTSRERLSENAMLKAVGFSTQSLVMQTFLESALLLLAGAFFGCLLATLLISSIEQQFSGFLPGVAIANSHYLLAFAIAIFSATLCCIYPAITIKRMSICKALGANS